MFAVAATIGIWIVMRITMPGILVAKQRPELAFAVRPASTLASTSLAMVQLSRGNIAAAEGLARSSVARAPYDQRALATLAAAAERRGKRAEAAQRYTLAAGLGWRNGAVATWLFGYGLETRSYRLAAAHGDALVRRGRERTRVFAGFREMLETPEGAAALAERFRDDPPWRALFFRDVGRLTPGQRRGLEGLLVDLARMGKPASEAERAPLGARPANAAQPASAPSQQRSIS
ncbi:hypothetical protein [Sphingomonas hengshuiensis]|nr:hypothetical protein [Sphingomonas hengshuiensis]